MVELTKPTSRKKTKNVRPRIVSQQTSPQPTVDMVTIKKQTQVQQDNRCGLLKSSGSPEFSSYVHNFQSNKCWYVSMPSISSVKHQHTILTTHDAVDYDIYQMDDSGGRQPNRNEDGDQLGQADGTGCLENVKVLQDIRHCHQPQSTKKSKTYIHSPAPRQSSSFCLVF